MQITVNKIGDRLSGVIGSTKYNVDFSEELYKTLLNRETALANAESIEEVNQIIEDTVPMVKVTTEEIITTKCPYLVFNKKENKFYLKNKGVVSSQAVPQLLVDWIIESVEKNLDCQPVIYSWIRFLRNPTFTPSKAQRFAKYLTTTVVDEKERERLIEEEGLSYEVATERATFRDVSLTKSGLISTYKFSQLKYTKFDKTSGDVVDRYETEFDEETGKVTIKLPEWAEDYYLIPPIVGEGHDPVTIDGEEVAHRIKIGSRHELSWDQCNSNDLKSCVAGLHVGGLKYIKNYSGNDRLLLNCFVDPANIAAITDDGTGAIRTREYFVHSACFAPNKNLYRESGYASHTEKEWEKLREEAIKLSEEKIILLKTKQNELNAL